MSCMSDNILVNRIWEYINRCKTVTRDAVKLVLAIEHMNGKDTYRSVQEDGRTVEATNRLTDGSYKSEHEETVEVEETGSRET